MKEYKQIMLTPQFSGHYDEDDPYDHRNVDLILNEAAISGWQLAGIIPNWINKCCFTDSRKREAYK